MKVAIRLLAHSGDRCIYVLLQNLEDRPVKRYRYSPQQVDEGLFDRLGRLLLREEAQLVTRKVDDDVRERLRRQIEEERRQRERELARIAAEQEAERLAEQEGRLGRRARRALEGGLDAVSERLNRLSGKLRSGGGESDRD